MVNVIYIYLYIIVEISYFYAPLIPTNVLFLECCDLIQVFYGSTNQEYTYANIYGYYVRQEDLINGRAWYKNEGRSIWWDGTDDWMIGLTTEKGGTSGYASLRNDGSCLPKISNPKWILWDGSWNDAGSQDVKIQCGFKPTGHYKLFMSIDGKYTSISKSVLIENYLLNGVSLPKWLSG